MKNVIIVLVSGLLLGFAWPLRAHDSWINKGGYRNLVGEWCCGENDCFIFPKEDVELHADGYHLLMRLTNPKSAVGIERVPFAEVQPSPDGEYWRCRKPDGSRRCFFAPPPST